MSSSSAASPKICEKSILDPILDALSDGFLFVGEDGLVQAANGKVAEFFGLTAAEMVGQPVNGLAERMAKCFAEFMTYHEVFGYPLHDQEHSFLRDIELATPRHLFLQVSSAPVVKEGVFSGRLWTLRDITSEREITELKIQYGGARGADELKSKFLTVIAHQLRTPMNSVRWNTEMLLSGDVAGVTPEMREILEEVYKAVANSLSIIDDMLLAVDIEQRTLRLEKSEDDLGDILRKAVHEQSRSAELKGIRLSLRELPKDMPMLFLDGTKIGMALNRVLGNSIRYTSSGGTVEISASVGKADVSVSVRDTGIGIAKADQAKLFQRFYRAKKAMELFPDASGLGLYITKFIVDAHDGKIAIESDEGLGTTVTITLPRKAVAK